MYLGPQPIIGRRLLAKPNTLQVYQLDYLAHSPDGDTFPTQSAPLQMGTPGLSPW